MSHRGAEALVARTALAFVCACGVLHAAITPQLGVSRTTGVAPLAVFVDATTTTGLDGGDYVNANFAWSFDRDGVDPTGRHTVTRGFVAAHVYENPGTYTVQLTVHDRLGAAATATAQVVVTAFTGTTYYVATGGSNSAAGTSMAAPLATADYAILQKAGPNTRVLLRRGDRFTIPVVNINDKAGPVMVSAYTDPNRASTEEPILYCSADGWGVFNIGGTTSDWRFVDVHLRSVTSDRNATPCQRGVTVYETTTDILFLRVEVDSVGRDAFQTVGLRTSIVDCSLHDFGSYALYCSTVNRTAFVGNVSRRQTGGEHFLRVQGGSKAFLAYNDFAEVASAKSSMQVRGTTSQVYEVGNRLELSSGFHPQNSTSQEYISYCVADGNTYINSGIGIAATHIAVRNNLLYNSSIGLDDHPLVGMSDSVTILNNSCYGTLTELVSGSATNTVIKNNLFSSTTTLNYAKGLYLGNALSNYQIDNNIYYAPSKGGPLWFTVNGVDLGRSGFADWQAAGGDVHGRYADPLFASTDSPSPDFLRLSASSPARGAGAVVPVFCDYDGTPRTVAQATDAGARLYGTASVRSLDRAAGRTNWAPAGSRVFDLLGRSVALPVRGPSPCCRSAWLVLP